MFLFIYVSVYIMCVSFILLLLHVVYALIASCCRQT